MVTQEVELALSPAALLPALAGEPFAFALDGGGPASWGVGEAFLGFAPSAVLQVSASGEAIVRHANQSAVWSGDPLTLVERFHRHFRPAATIVALSYELRHSIERLPSRAHADLDLPIVHAAAYPWVLRYDYRDRRYRLQAADDARGDIPAIVSRMRGAAPAALAPLPRLAIEAQVSPAAYAQAVEKTLAYIAAGDVYQVNLAQRFSACHHGISALSLFDTFQKRNPMPFAAFIDAGGFQLVCGSPECLLHRDGQQLATFPIKGTRPRGHNAAADAERMRSLQSDPKERAEHVMIVDLERNDLGKICRIGSVAVEELARIVTFPTLHHMISKIVGEARPEVGLAEILRALFPGGSITGAPKIRAMEIIDELEPVQRGFYTGALGVLFEQDRALFNIAIRTATVTRDRVSYHAGGGLVIDSLAASEYAETLLKSQSFFEALGRSRYQ